MDTTTTYLGLKLKNPVIAGASPLSKSLDTARRLEDAGAAALVMYSLFEEQIDHDKREIDHFLHFGSESYAEALDYFPAPKTFANLNAEEYVDHVRKLKKSLSIPVIASLNGVSAGGWMEYATRLQEAGADALELNVYYVPTDPALGAAQVEQMYLDDLAAVKKKVRIPVAVKVGPFFSAFANFATHLDRAGADGLVLFNRFFGPEIDLETLEVVPKLVLSKSSELALPLRWIAVLHGLVKADIAATSGIHEPTDVIKALMVGATVVQSVSALLTHGPGHLQLLVAGMREWMEKHEYSSVAQMRGSMSYRKVSQPAAFERANYMKILQSWE